MTLRPDNSLHFHIRWMGKEDIDWQCFNSLTEALLQAAQIAFPREGFTIEEVSTTCPRYRVKTEISGRIQ
jgi:hypothetical protein